MYGPPPTFTHKHTHHNHSTSQHTALAVDALGPTFSSSLMTTERLDSPDRSNTPPESLAGVLSLKRMPECCITMERRGKYMVAIRLLPAAVP